MIETFDLANVEVDEATRENESGAPRVSPELKEWAEKAISDRHNNPVVFDIETGARPLEELKALYHEKALNEFSASCDQRWKPETKAAKYEEYKANAWEEFVEKAALSPVTGRVLLIGILIQGEPEYLCTHCDSGEVIVLRHLWTLVDQFLASKRVLIGHNSNAFDLPFLVRRSWALDVLVPREVRQGRYWNPLFQDTMEHWNCGQREYVSLNTLGQFFGVGQKTEGIEGADFAKLWFGTMEGMGTPAEQRAKAIEYNDQDLRLTAAIAEKMGMM
jgi:hypothetical protein